MSSENPPGNPTERELFEQALDLAPEARERFLDAACGMDAALRKRISALLLASDEAEGFLPNRPAMEGASSGRLGITSEKAGDQIGRYHLLEKIGEGGCGIVYMAEQREPVRRRVALKILKPGMDTRNVVARFEAERQALALMDHPNIARVLDGGETDSGRPYFVMELVRGVRVTEFCDSKRLSPRERMALFIQICLAIQHAHQKGIIHRDIKPSNILVTVNDDVAVPKVIDFGIAKATGQSLTDKTLFTQFHGLIGTPAYMSPEQMEFSSVDIDTRTDVYSLGVLLYELLVGRTPFDSHELLALGWEEMRRTVREKEPMRPSTRIQSIPEDDRTSTAQRRRCDAPRLYGDLRGDIDWIVLKCLEKDRGRRYDSVGALVQDIIRHLQDEPIAARPPSVRYRLRKAVQRHRIAFLTVGAIATTLILTAVFATWMFFRERTARELAESATQKANHETQAARRSERTAQLAAYAADIQTAQTAINETQRGRTRALLEGQRPTKGAEDLRGIEWRWLWNASRDESVQIVRHPGIVRETIVSRDGAWVATVCLDGVIRIWESATLKQLTQFKEPSPNGLTLSFDGALVAIATADGTVVRSTRSWDVVRVFPGLNTPLSFTTNGASLFGVEGGQWVRWSLNGSERKLLPDALDGHPPQRLAELGNDRLVINAEDQPDHMAVISRETGELLQKVPGLYATRGLAGSSNGRWVAAGTANGEVAVWDVVLGRWLGMIKFHDRPVRGVAFSSDDQQLATASADQLVRLWEMPPPIKGFLHETEHFQGHESEVWGVRFLSGGHRLVSGGKDSTLRTWNVSPLPIRASKELYHPSSLVMGITPDGGQVISLSDSRRIDWWRTDDDQLAEEQILPFTPQNLPLWGGDGRLFARDEGGSVQVWDTRSKAISLTLSRGGMPLHPVGYGTNGTWLAVAEFSAQRKLHLYQLPKTEPILVQEDFSGERRGFDRMAAFSPDGTWVAYPGREFTVSLLNLKTHTLQKPLRGFVWNSFSLAFSPDSRLLAGTGWDGNLCVWNCETGERVLGPFAIHGNAVNHVEFSADGRSILTTCEGGTLRFWNAHNGRQMLSYPEAESTGGALLPADDRSLIFWNRYTYRLIRWDLSE